MKFNTYKRCVVTLICTVLTACSASGGPGASKKTEYMMQGCIGGGVLGAVLGSTLGKGGDDTAKGAAFGCALGAVIAFSIAERTEKYANDNAAIEKEIARNKKNTAELRNYNKGLQDNINIYNGEINKLRSQQAAAKQDNQQLQKLKSLVTEQANKAQQALQSVNNELGTAHNQASKYNAKASATDSNNWQQEIAALEKERDILNEHVQTLSAMNSSI